MKLKILSLTAAVVVCGCSTTTVQHIDGATLYTAGSCSVQVYPTKAEAKEAGPFREICIVSGSSAFSFDHSIQGAIKKNIPGICQCGTDTAYIEARSRDSNLGVRGVSHVTLIGIKPTQH